MFIAGADNGGAETDNVPAGMGIVMAVFDDCKRGRCFDGGSALRLRGGDGAYVAALGFVVKFGLGFEVGGLDDLREFCR